LNSVHDFDAETNIRIINRIREELAHRRMSRPSLADAAGISISTLEKTMSRHRPVTLATLVKLEDALGITLLQREQAKQEPSELAQVAPTSMGSYSRTSVKWIEGQYLTLRPSITDAGSIFAYATKIYWDDTLGHLVFFESERTDSWFEQTGHVTISNVSGHVYLVTNSEGQYRTLTLGRAPKYKALMGILSTLAIVQGSHGMPMACPIVLTQMDDNENPGLGKFEPGDDDYAKHREMLDYAVAAEFVHFLV
jgi:transcriptional regulator with XRE-family HTH domain